jgi:hypothetical protein
MVQPQNSYFAAIAGGQIDTEAGIIRGVAVVTEGVAKGHGVFIDAETIRQVKACAETYAGGLKVKMNHSGGAGDIVGFLREFRIDGTKLLADLHLLTTTPHRGYVLEIAKTIPDTFGLSIAFAGVSEKQGGKNFARCTEIFSADLVDEPAANPSGLFDAAGIGKGPSIPPPAIQPIQKMEDSQKEKDPIAELAALCGALSARLEKLESAMPKPEVEIEAQAKITNAAKLGAQEALKLFTEKFGEVASTKPSGEAKAAPALKFEQIVADRVSSSKATKIEAIRWAMNAHSAEYADYLDRQKDGPINL